MPFGDQYIISLVFADGVFFPVSSWVGDPEPTVYNSIRIITLIPEKIEEDDAVPLIEEGLTKGNIKWLYRLASHRKWCLDFTELKIDNGELEKATWCSGRVQVEHSYRREEKIVEAQLEYQTWLEWIYPGEQMKKDHTNIPPELQPSYDNFKTDHKDGEKCAFVIMRFENTTLHDRCFKAIEATCQAHGLKALRADSKEYTGDLLANVRTYLHGCGFGIAVFERLTTDNFNPNVSLEVGYMMGLGKHVCLLKDQTLTSLHTDLVGRLYRRFDPQAPEAGIQSELTKWLTDMGIISPKPTK